MSFQDILAQFETPTYIKYFPRYLRESIASFKEDIVSGNFGSKGRGYIENIQNVQKQLEELQCNGMQPRFDADFSEAVCEYLKGSSNIFSQEKYMVMYSEILFITYHLPKTKRMVRSASYRCVQNLY
jgi:hypothetical protein